MDWRGLLTNAAFSGSCASAGSSLVLAARGRAECDSAAAPNNGPSQWVWGRRGARARHASLRNTAVGYGIHHAVSVAWAMLFERLRGAHAAAPLPRALAAGALTAALAYVVDYKLAPRRLQPGFDVRLGPASLFLVYASFAGGLALAAPLRALLRRQTRRLTRPDR
jgi:hypothetical protein